MPAPENGKELAEMQLLPPICDIHNLVRREFTLPVHERGQVGRCVVEPPVRLAHERRVIMPLTVARHEKWIVLFRPGPI